MLSRLFAHAALIAFIAVCISPLAGWSQGTLAEYKAFDYVRDPATGLINRVEMPSAQYEEQQNALKQNLKAVVSQVLLGTFSVTPELIEPGDTNPLTPLILHPNFLLLPRQPTATQQQAAAAGATAGRPGANTPQAMTQDQILQHVDARLKRLFAVPSEIQNRIKDNPDYLDEVADSMAAWTVYYLNLSNWQTYVAQSIVREDLADNEKSKCDPSTAKEDGEAVYAALQTHAQNVGQDLENLYGTMVASIEKDNTSQANYEEWLQSKQRDMIDFAHKWIRRYEGTEINIDDTVYLVRSYEDRPKASEEDRFKESLPDNGVLVEVPKKLVVTPFDLIKADGHIKTAE